MYVLRPAAPAAQPMPEQSSGYGAAPAPATGLPGLPGLPNLPPQMMNNPQMMNQQVQQMMQDPNMMAQAGGALKVLHL